VTSIKYAKLLGLSDTPFHLYIHT